MDGEIRFVGPKAGRGHRIGVEEIATPASARMLMKQGRRVLIIHADRDKLDSVVNGTDGFFPKLAERALRDGIQTRVVRAESKVAAMMSAPGLRNVHITMGDAPRYVPDALHVALGPVSGFWYLDEVGVKANSSIRFNQFAPERIEKEPAEYFFNGVTGWMLSHNVSPIRQPARVDGGLDRARATIFCQEIERHTHRAHFLTTEEMIRTVAEHERERLIYLKPHPAQSKPMRRDIIAVAQDYPNVMVTDASVHDLAAAADIVVTQNSGAGFEALMQKKTVVTCAKSDYWQATLTARTATELREAMDYGRASMKGFPYEKFLYWFLHRHLLEVAKDNFADRAWERIADKVFL
ncbi:capsular polysaccharide biosynthesis protein [Maritimibacter alkaliphilus HTCC2654]|nr:capsular polysaccharide biosynthesis protein [Maritimibacter alkaliphilus HTCC2654]